MRIALRVAGSDPTGGAGLQLDLQVFRALGVQGAGVLTALTIQDTKKVHRVLPVFPSVASDQLRALLAEGMPEVSADFRVWTIRIKRGVYFADDPVFKGQRQPAP